MIVVWILRIVGLAIVAGAGVGIVYVLVDDTLGRWLR